MAKKRGRGAAMTKRMEPDGAERAIRRAISSGEIIATGVVNLVRTTLVTALGGAHEVGGEAGGAAVAAVRGSIRAVSEIGGDLGLVVKQAIRGTVQAVEEIGGDLGGVARSASKGAVKAAEDVGGDVAVVARKAVEGAIEAAREIGADVGALATSAAEGAVEAADRIGTAAGRAVRRTLSGTIAGVKVVVHDVTGRPGTSPAAAGPTGGRARRGARKRARA